MKVLFICNQNRHRSKTAEELFKDKFDTKSAGLFNEYPVTEEEIQWADAIVVMEAFQIDEIKKRFPKYKKRIVSLDIADMYVYRQPELIELLKAKIKKVL